MRGWKKLLAGLVITLIANVLGVVEVRADCVPAVQCGSGTHCESCAGSCQTGYFPLCNKVVSPDGCDCINTGSYTCTICEQCPGVCGQPGPTNTPHPSVGPSPTPVPVATTNGELVCRHGGVYPNKWQQTTQFNAWVSDATNAVVKEVVVQTNTSGNGKGVFSISNWVPGYFPTYDLFALRSGLAGSSPNGNGNLISGFATGSLPAGCSSPFEVCHFNTIKGTQTGGWNFYVTDVNPASMQVASCGPNKTGPFTLNWQHAQGSPSRYLIRVNSPVNGNAINPPDDIRCFKSASELGCGDGTCSFSPPAGGVDGCGYKPGNSYDWWSVQPKTNGPEYFCEQAINFSCTTTPTPTPPLPTPTNTPVPTPSLPPGLGALQVSLYETQGALCAGTTPISDGELTGEVAIARLTVGNEVLIRQDVPPFDPLFEDLTPGVYRVDVNDLNRGWSVAQCNGLGNIQVYPGQTANKVIYLQPQGQQWWQVMGGDAMANKTTVDQSNMVSLLPESQSLIKRLAALHSAGLAGVKAGRVNIGASTGVSFREDNNWVVQYGYDTSWQREGYDYFKNNFGVLRDWPQDNPVTNAVKPRCGSETTCGYWRNGDLMIREGSTWESWAFNQEKIVVFVEGNLTIQDDIIINSVANGTFIAFIVKGNIVVDSDVTQLNGIYVADGQIDLGDGGGQFRGRGVFVGWGIGGSTGGVRLVRRSADVAFPAETFIYWPELVLNTPVELTHTRRFFREGTPRDIIVP